MVVLNKIYTRTGDDGTTALGSGRRVAKYDLRVECYGTLDETNAAIGLARLHTRESLPVLDAMLARIQNDLFDLGADLCFPDETRDQSAVGFPVRGGALRQRQRQGRRDLGARQEPLT
jgi:cob(I)alamin adenosyltransferase